jgi:protein TonB
VRKYTPNIFTSFVLSALLHCAAAAFVVGFYNHKPSQNIRNVEHLTVQIEGVIAEKQVEAKKATPPPPPQIPTPKPPPAPKPKPQPRPTQESARVAEQQPEPSPKEEIEPERVQPPQATQSDTERQAQRLKDEEEEKKVINRYLVAFKKRLSPHISYPQEAKKMGYIGVPTVALSILEDGSVEEVRVIKSGGYEVLDKSAVEAVIKAAPFAKPPRILRNVEIEIYFKKD